MDYQKKMSDMRIAIYAIALAIVVLALIGKFVVDKLSH